MTAPTTRTATLFNRQVRARHQYNPSYIHHFWTSETARLALVDDPGHEGKCLVYSDSRLHRFAGCLEQAVMKEFLADYLAGSDEDREGVSEDGELSHQSTYSLVTRAIEHFGESVSLQREREIIPVVVAHRGHSFGSQEGAAEDAARIVAYNALIATFDDVVLSSPTATLTVSIGGETPHLVRPNEPVTFDAGVVVKILNISVPDTTPAYNIYDVTLPDGYQIATWAVYKTFNPYTDTSQTPNADGFVEGEARKRITNFANLTGPAYTTALADTAAVGAERAPRVFLRFELETPTDAERATEE